jgi:nuclear pore complex protein Nup85
MSVSSETSWYHCIPAQLLFGDPFMKELQLSVLAKDALETLSRPEDYTAFDMLLISAFNYDLMEIVRQGCLFNDNWWFVAHFVDLMAAGNQLKNHEIEKEDRLREFLLLDYAETLVSHSSLWALSVEYFDSCPQVGRKRLEAALERVTLDSERKANEVLNLAIKRRLKNLFKTTCRTMSQKWLSKGSLASALVWAVKADDARICSAIADSMLNEFVETSTFVDTDVISSLGSKMLISDRLTFLSKYHEFHEIMKQKTSEARAIAAELLVSLVASNISPPYFVPILLLNAETILANHDTDGDQPLFNAGQCCQILASLEDALDIHASGDDDLSKVSTDKMNQLLEKEGKLRLSLERVLSQSSLERNIE